MKKRSRGISDNDYVVVNFKGVGSRNRVVAVGNYRAMVMKVTKGISKPGNPKLDWIFEVSDGPEEGHRFQPYVTSLVPQSLWNLRAALEALSVEVPEEELQIVFGELKGLELGLTIEHETYEHRVKERIVDLFPLEELGGEMIEEEEEEEKEEEEKPAEKSSETEMDKMKKGEMPKDRLMTDAEAIELQKEEEAKDLVKEAKELTEAPKKIKIEEEETEEEEEEEEEDE